MNRSARSSGGDESTVGQVGRYALRSPIASGGMASVFLAHLQGLHGFEKTVAIKKIHPHLVRDRRFVEMFLDEARVAALIHHPNVCAVMDFGEDDGAPYLVMEYLDGEPFSTVLKMARSMGGCPFWLGARVIHDAARGLHAAHELSGPDGRPMGVVHRDVSPQNIFVLYDGVTKVVDFGVARARGRLSVTRTNEVKGKLPYMAPEQYEKDNADHRADIWALGVVLWEATTSRRLFRAGNDAATIARVLHKPVPLPSSVLPDYPKRLEAIVMRCLERDLDLRYETADQLAEDLESFLYSSGRPAGTSQVKKWMSTHFADRIEYRQALMRGELPDEPLDYLDSMSTLSSFPSRPSEIGAARQGRDLPSATADARAAAESAGHVQTISDFPTLANRPATRKVAPPSDASPFRRESVPVSALGLTVAGVTMIFVLAFAFAWRSPTNAPALTAGEAPIGARALLQKESKSAAPSPEEVEVVEVVEAEEAFEGVADDEATEVASKVERSEPREAPRTATAHASPRPAARTPPGTLSLLAIPAASVILEGRVIGETPLVRHQLPAGTHRVTLRTRDGRSKTVTVQIRSGSPTHLRVEL